ncbi:MAG: ATP-dependent helicase [Rhodothermales bacterium]
MSELVLRDAQRQALAYTGGRMGIAAVPGSGKTTTLAVLATHLVRQGWTRDGGHLLIVTYQRAAAENIRQRVGKMVRKAGLSASGVEARTLHSLAFGIVRSYPGLAGLGPEFGILGGRTRNRFIDQALTQWRTQFPDRWAQLVSASPSAHKQLERLLPEVCRSVISTAKNLRQSPKDVAHLVERSVDTLTPFLDIGRYVYEHYVAAAEHAGLLDFDDMVWRAADLLDTYPHVRDELRSQWRVVLEDESQDSVPLQETLIGLLTGEGGNWVRVGDPNQAITSSFTAADPKYFRQFVQAEGVQTVELDESGRCTPKIIMLANHLVDWVRHEHPVHEVRQQTFRDQRIHATRPGDPQPNPPDEDSRIHTQIYDTREDEVFEISKRAAAYAQRTPMHTLAIVTPTNAMGYEVIELLKKNRVPFDEALQGNPVVRMVLDGLRAVFALVATPFDRAALEDGYLTLRTLLPDLDQSGDHERVAVLLRSCYHPEQLVFPTPGTDPRSALPPADRFTPSDYDAALRLAAYLRRWLAAAEQPIYTFTMAVAYELFSGEALDIARLAAAHLRQRADQHPDWRLRDFAAEIQGNDMTRILTDEDDEGFEPRPGIVTVTTMHRAKGLEWDLVFLLGVDAVWFPHTLDDYFRGEYAAFGGNPEADATLTLQALVEAERLPSRRPTDIARCGLISERLRLLYVGITRARRHLMLSCARMVEQGGRFYPTEPATAFLSIRSGFSAKRA